VCVCVCVCETEREREREREREGESERYKLVLTTHLQTIPEEPRNLTLNKKFSIHFVAHM